MHQINAGPSASTAVAAPSPIRPGRRRGLRASVAAAGLGCVLLAGGCTTTGAPEAASDPTAVATQFVEASYAFDLDTAQSLLATDVQIAGAESIADWRAGLAWTHAAAYSIVGLSCTPASTSPDGTHVHCAYSLNALGSERLGRGPYADNTYDITVVNGQITAAEENWPYIENGFSEEMWEPMQAWVAAERPKDYPVLYDEHDNQTAAEREQELSAWTRNIDEYVAAHQ